MPTVAGLNIGAPPVVFGQHVAAVLDATTARRAIVGVIGFIEIPGGVIQRDLFAGCDVTFGNHGYLIGKPAIRIAGMIEMLVETVMQITDR